MRFLCWERNFCYDLIPEFQYHPFRYIPKYLSVLFRELKGTPIFLYYLILFLRCYLLDLLKKFKNFWDIGILFSPEMSYKVILQLHGYLLLPENLNKFLAWWVWFFSIIWVLCFGNWFGLGFGWFFYPWSLSSSGIYSSEKL